jgi:hypothetical protein
MGGMAADRGQFPKLIKVNIFPLLTLRQMTKIKSGKIHFNQFATDRKGNNLLFR